jgi:Protein of unknown function (DUF2845)
MQNAPVAQLDRVTVSEAVGRGFDSRRARQFPAARLAALLLSCALVAAPVSAESFRCGQWIASPEMSVEELLQKCGEPTSRTVETVDVYGHSANGGRIKTGVSTVEKLTYDRGNQSFPMIVTIVDGKITSMEREE